MKQDLYRIPMKLRDQAFVPYWSELSIDEQEWLLDFNQSEYELDYNKNNRWQRDALRIAIGGILEQI